MSSADPPRAVASLEELDELADRYRALVDVAQSAPGRTPARRDQLREVAARFPTALRELDRIGLDGVRERAAAIDALRSRGRASGAPVALGRGHGWVRALLELVPRLRTVLGIKAWLAANAPGQSLRSADARARVRSCYPFVDDGLLDRIASPPRGQAQQIAYEDAARALAVEVEELKRILYGD